MLNRPTERIPFAITRFEGMEEPDIEDPHSHDFYEIIWVEEGTSVQAIDHIEYTLSPGTLFFISPGQLHFFAEWEQVRGGSILFSQAFVGLGDARPDTLFALSFLDNLYAAPMLILGPDDLPQLRQTIHQLEAEAARPNTSATLQRAYLLVLLGQIQRLVDTTSRTVPHKPYVVLYKRLMELVEQHYRTRLGVQQYADMLSITQHHLNLVVKDVTGQTAGEAIRERTLREAKRLLTFTDLTVTEIADTLGFEDIAYFARLFRRDAGQGPMEFRKTMSEKYRKV
jgi:AraC family transcriptional regulator, transcriptional activator of pobA